MVSESPSQTEASDGLSLASATISVVGFGVTGRSVIGALLARGAKQFHVVDDTDPDAQAARFIHEIAESHPGSDLEFHRRAPQSWKARWMTSSQICVLASDTVDPTQCLEVNAACQAASVPLVPGLGMGEVAQVGPVIVPSGGGACLQCIEIRVQTALGRSALAGFYPPNPALAAQVGNALAELIATGGGWDPDAPLTYLWEDGTRTTHQVLRTVHCPACGCCAPRPAFDQPTEFELGESFPEDPGRILRLQPMLVDSITGIVRWVTSYAPQERDPPISHAVASVADPVWTRLGQQVYAGGNDIDADRAAAAALGEALDRISATAPSADHIRVATYDEVAADAIAPELFDLFDARTRRIPNFPYSALRHDVPMSWVWGWSTAQARPVVVPASRVFVPFMPVSAADQLDAANVSGCATGASRPAAALSGLLEVIERDTFMITWATRAPVTAVAIDEETPWEIGQYVKAFHRVGLEVRCSTVTLDWGVPVAFAIAKSQHPGDPAAVVAAAADSDLAHACRRALKELTANLAHVRTAMQGGTPLPSENPVEVRTQDAHALLFARPEMARHLDHWWAPKTSTSLVAPREPQSTQVLANLIATIAASGHDAIVVDLTLPRLAEHGLWTMKTLVTGAYPMNFDAAWPQFGGDRIRTAPVAAGLLARPIPFERLNRTPHPFP